MNRFTQTVLRFFPVPRYLDVMYPALDISQSSVKCIHAMRRGANLIPDSIEDQPLPDGCIVEGLIKEPEALASALLALKKKRPFTHAIVTVPEEHAYIFPVRVTARGRVEQKTEIEFAMSEHVPIPLEHVVYTFESITPDLAGVIAYDSRISTEYEQVLSMAGVTAVSFVPHIVASARASRIPTLQHSYIVVDIGRTRSTVALVYGGVAVGSSTVYIGSKIFTEKLRAAGLAAEDAYIELQTKGIAANPALRAAWAEISAGVLPYINLWRGGRCSETITLPPPREIYLCGGGAPIQGIADALAEDAQLPVRLASVWQRLFTLETHVPSVSERDSYRYASAAGLLLSNL
jgi:Tfp pilus assembly PilM family ATPase